MHQKQPPAKVARASWAGGGAAVVAWSDGPRSQSAPSARPAEKTAIRIFMSSITLCQT